MLCDFKIEIYYDTLNDQKMFINKIIKKKQTRPKDFYIDAGENT